MRGEPILRPKYRIGMDDRIWWRAFRFRDRVALVIAVDDLAPTLDNIGSEECGQVVMGTLAGDLPEDDDGSAMQEVVNGFSADPMRRAVLADLYLRLDGLRGRLGDVIKELRTVGWWEAEMPKGWAEHPQSDGPGVSA